MTLSEIGLDNRKLALIIWVMVFIAFLLISKAFRKPVAQLIQTLFCSKVTVVFLLAASYIVLVVHKFSEVQFWKFSMLTDSILWFVGTGVIFLMNTSELSDKSKFISRLKQVISYTIFIDFFVNLYSFNIIVELLLLPVIFFIAMFAAVAGQNEKYKKISVMTNWLLAGIGFVFLAHSLSMLAKNIAAASAVEMAESILLAPMLTLSFLPFMYSLGMYSSYESLFVTVNHVFRDEPTLIKRIKMAALKECHLNYWKLDNFRKSFYLRFSTQSES